MSADRHGRPSPITATTPVRTPHHCGDNPCAPCLRAIDAAEDAWAFGDEGGAEMDARAEWEVRG